MAPGFERSTVPGVAKPPGAVKAAALVEDRADRAARSGRLQRLAGPGELRAAVLALLLTGSARERAVWRDECAQVATREAILSDLLALSPRQRLPWMERFVRRLSHADADQRRGVLQAARRLMAADGRTDARDRLRWLGLRHGLTGGGRAPDSGAVNASAELEALDADNAHAVVAFSAHLSRLVPSPELDVELHDHDMPAGLLWWRAVIAPWPALASQRLRPDADALVHALRLLKALPWMLQPVLVRRWLDAAVVLSPPGQLHPDAAEALRIAARLLDCPLPPALAACFEECEPEPAVPVPPT
jgi:hypothetical protein